MKILLSKLNFHLSALSSKDFKFFMTNLYGSDLPGDQETNPLFVSHQPMWTLRSVFSGMNRSTCTCDQITQSPARISLVPPSLLKVQLVTFTPPTGFLILMSPDTLDKERDSTMKAKTTTPSRADLPEGYPEFIVSLKQRIRSAQVKAAVSVNRELVHLYWQIGNDILTRQRARGLGCKGH